MRAPYRSILGFGIDSEIFGGGSTPVFLDYSIETGKLYGPHGQIAGDGVSGNGQCKNNSSEACVRKANVGPIPPGIYPVGVRGQYNKWKHPAIPLGDNKSYERTEFYIHGMGTSDGCVMFPNDVVDKITASIEQVRQKKGDLFLRVHERYSPAPEIRQPAEPAISRQAPSGILGGQTPIP